MPIRQGEFENKMNPALQSAFARTVSAPRWKSYMLASGFRSDSANSLYLWNVAIGQSFHFPIQALEVALRNVIANALAEGFGQDWWRNPACMEMIGNKLQEDILKAQRRYLKRTGKETDTGQIIASLSLGFWAATLNSRHQTFWHQHRADAFPYFEKARPLRELSLAINRIHDLRNRIAHHEPVFRRSLSDDYGVILRILGWICPQTRGWVRENSSVPAVLRMRP